MQELGIQLNASLNKLELILQRIEGLDGQTTEFYGDIQHKNATAKIGLYNTTKVAQQSHIVDAVTTTTELDALGAKINEILVVLETIGITKNA